MKKLLLEIVVDSNDGDYLTNVLPVTNEELELMKPLIEEIKNWKKDNYNYGTGDAAHYYKIDQYPNISKEIHYLFEDFCPYGEYGFHSIKSISVYPEIEKERLL